jgi:hypothetical protein
MTTENKVTRWRRLNPEAYREQNNRHAKAFADRARDRRADFALRHKAEGST